MSINSFKTVNLSDAIIQIFENILWDIVVFSELAHCDLDKMAGDLFKCSF